MIIKFLFLLENTRTCSKDVPGPESRCYKVVANINKHHIRDLFTVHITLPPKDPYWKKYIIKISMSMGKYKSCWPKREHWLLLFARLSYYFSPVLHQTSPGHKAHKVGHASLGSRFGQQDLYFPALIEILMIYFFQYGSFGGSVCGAERTFYIFLRYYCFREGLKKFF